MRVFVSHSSQDRELVEAIAQQLQRQGDQVADLNNISAGDDVVSQVFSTLRSADIVIAILTSMNPNIYYELGVAVGAGQPVLVVAASGDQVPAEIAGLPYLERSGNPELDAEKIAIALTRFTDVRLRTHDNPPNEIGLAAAAKNPAYLDAMMPHRFEELVRAWFAAQGLEIDRPREHVIDRSYDFAVRDRDATYLVEVKKMTRQNRVSVDVVRRLISSVAILRATGAILISPSGFTTAAVSLAASMPVALLTLDDLVATTSMAELWDRAAATTSLQLANRAE